MKKTCTFYFGGRGVCYLGDKCRFSHAETLPRQEVEEEVPLTRMIMSSLPDEELYREFNEELSAFLRGDKTAAEFLKEIARFNLSHLIIPIAKSLKPKYPIKRYHFLKALENEGQVAKEVEEKDGAETKEEVVAEKVEDVGVSEDAVAEEGESFAYSTKRQGRNLRKRNIDL